MFEDIFGKIHSTATLPRLRIVDAEFENPDGSDLIIDTDILDQDRNKENKPGPIRSLDKGKNYIRIW